MRPRSRAREVIAAATALALLGASGAVSACTDTGLSMATLLPGTCCYEGIRARCGELSIGPRTSGTTFVAVASKIANAVEREGGAVEISDADLRYIVARFSRRADLADVKLRLEAETTVRWVSYRPLVRPD